MTEIGFINSIARKNKHNLIGDDCAVIPANIFFDEQKQNTYLLVATDTINENVHFSLEYFTLFDVGYKALAVNLSDIAACAGIPLFYQVSITAPDYITPQKLMEIYKGFKKLAKKYSLVLSGGDTVKGNFLSLTITMFGKTNNPVYRHTAMPGDNLYVTGELGSSSYALELLQKGKNPKKSIKTKHLNPLPRIELMQKLIEKHKITACIDISDGLSCDIHRLKHSKTGFEIHFDKIPYNSYLKKLRNAEIFNHIINGGEDFELLFTSPEEITIPGVYKIGKANKTGKVTLLQNSTMREIKPVSYNHFSG